MAGTTMLTVVNCIDFRLFQCLQVCLWELKMQGFIWEGLPKTKNFIEFINRLDGKHFTFDLISIPGGGGHQDHCLHEFLKISDELHKPETIILIGHEDCGYGTTPEQIVQNKRSIQQIFPTKTILPVWLKLNNTWHLLS